MRGRRKALPFSKTTFELTNHSAQIQRGTFQRSPSTRPDGANRAGLLLCDGNAVSSRYALISRFVARVGCSRARRIATGALFRTGPYLSIPLVRRDPLQDRTDLHRRPFATASRRNAASIERPRDAAM